MGSKPKYCKCGHEKTKHKGKSKLSFAFYCRDCPCSSYLNKNRPFKSDYAVVAFSVVFAAFFVILSYVLIAETDPTLAGIENHPVDMTNGEMHKIIVLLIVLGNIFFVSWFTISPILDLIYYKKRREFPIKDEL